jgi:hypothetical protein
MIEKCDPEIACWSEAGDNFVVKNVEKFATVSCFVDPSRGYHRIDSLL